MLPIKNNEKLEKPIIYEAYNYLVEDPLPYDDITRKKMIDAMLQVYYTKPEVIYEMLSEEELNYLSNNLDKAFVRFEIPYFLRGTLLFSPIIKGGISYRYEVTTELKDVIVKALALYQKNKDQIEKDKYNAYICVGFVRQYYVVDSEFFGKFFMENQESFDKDATPFINSLFFRKNVDSFIPEGEMPMFYLRCINEDFEELANEGYDFPMSKTSIKDLLSIGRYNVNLEKACNQKFYEYAYDNIMLESDMLFIYQFENIDKDKAIKSLCFSLFGFDNGFEDPTEEQKRLVSDYVNTLPKYQMIDYFRNTYVPLYNENNVPETDDHLSNKDGKMVIDILIRLCKDYCDFKNYGRENIDNPSLSIIDFHFLLTVLAEEKFAYVNSFITNHISELSIEEIRFLKGLTKTIRSEFILAGEMNGTISGEIFYDVKKVYLVKGIFSPIVNSKGEEDMMLCRTFLMPFKDAIICPEMIFMDIRYFRIMGHLNNNKLQNKIQKLISKDKFITNL